MRLEAKLIAFAAALLLGITVASAQFDGLPASPQPFSTHSEYSGWDVQVHSRNADTWTNLESMQAGHGPDCAAPPATHENHTYAGAVYVCNNHLMTALNASGYGVIYLTPNKLLDWSNGPATLKFDMSTHKASSRDWTDIWLQSFDNNVALPLDSNLPDLQAGNITWFEGQALRGRQFLHIDNNTGGKRWRTSSHLGWLTDTGTNWAADSMTQRDEFVLTVNASTFSFCKTNEGICWAQNTPHGLTITQATVQVGHHSYTPFKDGAGVAGTWHWDNIELSPSVPFTIIKASQRNLTAGATVNFLAPAPANSYLRFSAIGRVRVNGVAVLPVFPTTHPEAHNSYFVLIPQGATSVTIGLEADGWYTGPFQAKDFAIWSRGAPMPTPTVTAPSPATPTSTPVPATPVPPTATPTPTPAVICYRSFDNGATLLRQAC